MERKTNLGLPVYVEREVVFDAPEKSILVHLPYVEETLFWDSNRQYLSMHTDMMGEFCRTINSLKPSVRNELLIQTRVMTPQQWEDLTDHDVFYFFYKRRSYRRGIDERRHTMTYLLPKGKKITEARIRDYFMLDFSPKTLASEIGFKVGWFRAEWLAKKAENEESFNSLAPFIGAINQFKIGSNTLKPGILRQVATRFRLGFESGESDVRNSIYDELSDEAIDASADIVKYSYR